MTIEHLTEKALDFQQRLKRRIIIRKLEPKLQRARKLAQRKMAGNDKIKVRSQRAAKNVLVRGASGGKNYSSLGTSQKIAIDRRLESKKMVIAKIAKRLFQGKRRQEMERLSRARHPKPNATAHHEEQILSDLELIAEIFDGGLLEGKNDPAIFKAVFLAGGPGSGKSFTADKIAFRAMGFKSINIDTFFEHALKKAGLSLKPESIYSELGQKIREKSKKTKENYEDILLRGRLGLVLDGTGKDIDKIKKYKDSLEKIGYETAMMFVNTDLETSKIRNKSRERTILDTEVENMWKGVQKNIGEFRHMFGNRFYVIDNSEGSTNFEKQTLTLFKQVQQWAKIPVNNPAAKEWRDSQ